MSRNFYSHVRADRAKWFVTVIAFLAVGVLICGLMTNWFKDFNPYCWFGHTYENGVCVKCQAEEPIEETAAEPVSVAYNFARLNNGTLGVLTPSVFATSTINEDNDLMTMAANGLTSVVNVLNNSKLLTIQNDIDNTGKIFLNANTTNFQLCNVNILDGDNVVCTKNLGVFVPAGLNVMELFNDGTLSYDKNYCLRLFQVIFMDGVTHEENVDLCYFGVFHSTPLPATPTKTGYTFTGWYTDEACTQRYTDNKVVGDITLYAGFTANTYSIKFNSNSGNGSMSNQSMTYDKSATLTSNSFNKEHYAFKGWATSANGNVVYTNGQSVNNLASTQNAVVNLYAVWERSEWTVTFNVDGETTTNLVAVNTAATLPDEPSKEGYNFVGWFFANGTQYTNQAITADTTLTAQFEIIRCRITFMLDGEVYGIFECDYGTNVSELLNATGVNPVLFSVAPTSLETIVNDEEVEIERTAIGNIIPEEYFVYVVIAACVVVVGLLGGIGYAISRKVKRK